MSSTVNVYSHLCSLILVEGVYLEWVEKYKDSPDEYVTWLIPMSWHHYYITFSLISCRLGNHHLFNPDHDKHFKVYRVYLIKIWAVHIWRLHAIHSSNEYCKLDYHILLMQELDKVISGWGDQVCHAPIMLAWMAFKFIALPKSDLEVCGHGLSTLAFKWKT